MAGERALCDGTSALAARYALDLVLVFGSRATGKIHARSDVDVAIRAIRGTVAFETLLDLSADLERLLDARVDVVDLRTADPLLLRKIFEHPVVLFSDGRAFAEERLRAFHRYQDYRRYLDLERQAVRRRLGVDAG